MAKVLKNESKCLVQYVSKVMFRCYAWWISDHFVFHGPLDVNIVRINDPVKNKIVVSGLKFRKGSDIQLEC